MVEKKNHIPLNSYHLFVYINSLNIHFILLLYSNHKGVGDINKSQDFSLLCDILKNVQLILNVTFN